MKRTGGRTVAVDPIDFVAVAVEKKKERRPADAEPAKNLLAGLVPPAGPVQDEVFLEIFRELRLAVILLTQQFAASSAARGEEIQEEELSLGFGPGQGIIDRTREPGLGGNHGREEQDADESESFFHVIPLIEFPSLRKQKYRFPNKIASGAMRDRELGAGYRIQR